MSELNNQDQRPDASPSPTRHTLAMSGGGRAWFRITRWWVANVPLGAMLVRLRTMVRRRESWLVLLAVIAGALAGLMVLILRELAYRLQQLLYNLGPNQRLSALDQ
ncbi:hypothetical protein DevBK_20520 [Devosia sp. BK]|uniref:hypothetical protein n=1 Tax=Devosia sp. BK TaxID=2871706 RepID=UPI00293B21BB|nr:hypothetical protein [Devosia sp. BK]MDV3253732.1 hypothetical protein [Devosia sp. BK]